MTSNDGSAEFQQMMLNYFGDRDYDSFEHNELNELKEKIGFALYGPPPKLTGYEDKQKAQIKFLLDTILAENNLISKWKDRVILSFIYNCLEPLPKEKKRRAKKCSDYKPEYDFNPIPIFVLRKCKDSSYPCRVFIDNTGRVYQTWRDYLTENKLPKCNMVLPKNGRYMDGPNGKVLLERHPSPGCNTSTKILQRADIASAIGGLASGGVFVAAAAVTVAPAVLVGAAATGIGIGVYSVGRSICNLVDRGKHKEDLSFSNSEARGAYLNILAGTLGLVGAGSSMAMSHLAARGVNIGTGAKTAFNVVNVANLGAGGLGVVNASYDVFDQWYNEEQAPSALTILQLSSSILFFCHAAYNFQTANTLIKESQANSLRDIRESLQSNRQRRTFNKLLKETIRQNDGNVQQGQAQVIKSIRSMDGNQDKVIATLTRWNKTFNKNKVRFAVQDGKVTLNGVVVDINEFGSMDKKQGITYLGKLPGIPKPTQSDIKTMSSVVKDAFKGIALEEIGIFAIGILKILGNGDMTINQKLLNAVASIINKLLGDQRNIFMYILTLFRIRVNYIGMLDEMFPHHMKYFKLIDFVSGYFQKLVDEVEKKYQQWYAQKDSSFEEPYFIKLSLDGVKRATEIFNLVTKAYFIGTNLTEYGLNKLLAYFYNWFTEQCYIYQEKQQRKEERKRHSNSLSAPQIKCKKCGGMFYDRTALYQNK